MNKETLTFRIGPLIGAQLLDIAQTNISKGNIEYGANVYKEAFHGFLVSINATCEYPLPRSPDEARPG